MMDLERVETMITNQKAAYKYVNREAVQRMMRQEFANQLRLRLHSDLETMRCDLSLATNFFGGCSVMGQDLLKKTIKESYEFLSLISESLPKSLRFIEIDSKKEANLYEQLDVFLSIYNIVYKKTLTKAGYPVFFFVY